MFMRQFDMNLLSILEDYQIILYKLLVRYLITYQINYQINFFLNHIAAIFFFFWHRFVRTIDHNYYLQKNASSLQRKNLVES